MLIYPISWFDAYDGLDLVSKEGRISRLGLSSLDIIPAYPHKP